MTRAATGLRVRPATLSDLPAGKAPLSAEMTQPIKKAFGPEMDNLLQMQLACGVATTCQRSRAIALRRYMPAAGRTD